MQDAIGSKRGASISPVVGIGGDDRSLQRRRIDRCWRVSGGSPPFRVHMDQGLAPSPASVASLIVPWPAVALQKISDIGAVK